MDENQASLYYKLILTFSIVLLTCFSWIFALERIISADTATYLFNMINSKSFFFGSHRFIAALTQVPTLIAIHLDAPLNLLIKVYSLSMFLLHAIMFLIILYVFKDRKTSIVFLFSHLIAGSLLFYYPVSEYQMGLSWMLLLYSYVNKFKLIEQRKVKYFIFPIVSLFFILYAHPLSIIFFSFLIAYSFINNHFKNFKKYFFVLLIIGAIYISKYLIFPLPNVTKDINLINELTLFPHHKWNIFWQYTKSYNFVFVILSIVNVIALFFTKNYRNLIFYIGFMSVHLYMCLMKQDVFRYNWYSEHINLALAFVTALVFIEQVWNLVKKEEIKLGMIVTVLVITLTQTYNRHHYNSNRIAYIEELLLLTAEQGTNRGIVKTKYEYHPWFWALNVESILLSASKTEFETSTVILRDFNEIQISDTSRVDNFLVLFSRMNSEKDLNQDYFKLVPAKYQIVEQEGL